MLEKDDAEHPVPEPLRPRFRQIAAAFAAEDYRLRDYPVNGVKPIDDDAAQRFANSVQAYGNALAPLSEATWERSVYRWMDGHWQLIVDLTTKTEPVSDLALHATLYEADGLLQLDSLHVP